MTTQAVYHRNINLNQEENERVEALVKRGLRVKEIFIKGLEVLTKAYSEK